MDFSEGRYADERPLPSEIELIAFRDEGVVLHFRLLNGDDLDGTIHWFDERVIRVVRPDKSEVTVYRHAVATYEKLR